jgi:hypothetical protein
VPPLPLSFNATFVDTMPPCRGHPVGATGYRGVTARVYDTYVAYITAVG